MTENEIYELRAQRNANSELMSALERRNHGIDAAICEAYGDTLGAEWHRLAAAGDREGEHKAWVRMMADLCLRNGEALTDKHSSDPKWDAQIAAEMERMAEGTEEASRARGER